MNEMAKNSRHISFGKAVVGIGCGIILLIAVLYLGLKFGPLPVAIADSAFPFEKQIVKIPLRARIDRETKTPPFNVNEQVIESGARIYSQQCAICHGTPGHDSTFAKQMYPPPPQLWKKHGPNGAVGLSDYKPGLAYWFVTNGVRLTGMPSFTHTLSDTERWQVSLLLANANKDLTVQVNQILNAPKSGAKN
jgi:mono/diheme cytochrome c family protein